MTDIEQILADAPRDIELYSVICGVVKLAGRGKNEETNEIMRIKTYTEDDGIFHWFNRYGQRSTRGECVLFPSREHRTWDDWQSVLFRAGDIIAIDAPDNADTKNVAIYVYAGDGYAYNTLGNRITVKLGWMRYATESEAQSFNEMLEGSGYICDECTKALVALDDLTDFDYVKLGGYDMSRGGLSSESTNQRMYRIDAGKPVDITDRFWKRKNIV